MTMKLNRRLFLAALSALGAAVMLPLPIARATAIQVDEAWKTLLEQPWHFEVNEHGTIVEPTGSEPSVRSQVYNISDNGIRSTEDLIDLVQSCAPLTSHFQSVAADELDVLISELGNGDEQPTGPNASDRLEQLEAALADEDDGWQIWVGLAGESELPRLKRIVSDWLADDIDWGEIEFFAEGWSGQGRAMAFFRDLDAEAARALGVVIIEGDCPGSSYYAAELRQNIPAANSAAEILGLPFRFRAEGAADNRNVT